MLRFERGAWSIIKLLRQATTEYPLPCQISPLFFLQTPPDVLERSPASHRSQFFEVQATADDGDGDGDGNGDGNGDGDGDGDGDGCSGSDGGGTGGQGESDADGSPRTTRKVIGVVWYGMVLVLVWWVGRCEVDLVYLLDVCSVR